MNFDILSTDSKRQLSKDFGHFEENMSRVRASSFPDLIPEAITNASEQPYDDSSLEGVASHVKLLLKLIQDHKGACGKEKNDGRRMLRVATMMTILDNVRDRIKKCQSFGMKASNPELRSCNTDLRRSPVPREKRPNNEPIADDKERLRRELSVSLSARKSLEIMCSSLGKEKEIMTGELSKKIYELRELDDLVNDLKEQNEALLEKVQECVSEHNEKPRESVALQERNKVLSDQLLRSLDGYKSMKRKLMLAQEENVVMRGVIDEMGAKVGTGLERVRSFKERLSNLPSVDVQEEIVALENMFECFEMLVDKHDQKKQVDCVTHKGEINF